MAIDLQLFNMLFGFFGVGTYFLVIVLILLWGLWFLRLVKKIQKSRRPTLKKFAWPLAWRALTFVVLVLGVANLATYSPKIKLDPNTQAKEQRVREMIENPLPIMRTPPNLPKSFEDREAELEAEQQRQRDRALSPRD